MIIMFTTIRSIITNFYLRVLILASLFLSHFIVVRFGVFVFSFYDKDYRHFLSLLDDGENSDKNLALTF
jgi:hypothetical protein